MKLAVIKDDGKDEKISSFVDSFDSLKEHLKMIYDKVTIVEDIDLRSFRKGADYPLDQRYLYVSEPTITLYLKVEKPAGMFSWSGPSAKLNTICTWKVVKLSLDDEIKPSPSTVEQCAFEFRDFNVRDSLKSSNLVVYQDYAKGVEFGIRYAKVLHKKSRRDESDDIGNIVVFSDKKDHDTKKYKVFHEFDMNQVCENDIVFIDYNEEIFGDNYQQLLNLLSSAKNKNITTVLCMDCRLNIAPFVQSSNHTILMDRLDTVDVRQIALRTIYKIINETKLFESYKSFLSIFKQLTSQFGLMVVSDNIVTWLES